MLRWRTAGIGEVLLVFLLLGAVQAVLIDQLPGLEPGKPDLTSDLLGVFLTWRFTAAAASRTRSCLWAPRGAT